MTDGFSRILVLAPHVDDGELGCGGTIHHFLHETNETLGKVNLVYAAFTFLNDGELLNEFRKAMATLGIAPENRRVLSFPIRRFNEKRQEILETMIKLREEFDPDLVLMPSVHDTHQDHQVISNEGLRAFKNTTLWGYELPWNTMTFTTQAFVKLTDMDLQKKIESFGKYKTQENRPYAQNGFIESLARSRGTQIGCQYAEAFEVIRCVIE